MFSKASKVKRLNLNVKILPPCQTLFYVKFVIVILVGQNVTAPEPFLFGHFFLKIHYRLGVFEEKKTFFTIFFQKGFKILFLFWGSNFFNFFLSSKYFKLFFKS